LWQRKGGSESIDVPPQYNATLPLPPSNVTTPANPGSRECSFTWVVRGENGAETLWLFGGMTTEEVNHMDVWTYDLLSNNWTWVAGSNITNGTNQYNESAPGGASPSARACGASWIGADGALYLFGGYRMTNLSLYTYLYFVRVKRNRRDSIAFE
jgi:hypothetical protein